MTRSSPPTVGILQTGHLPADLQEVHGGYLGMFRRLFAAHAPGPDAFRFEAYPVVDGVFPDSVGACDVWLLTGSRFGVYDPEPWIPRLEAFIRSAYAEGVPLIGVCFGHQIMAQALGGDVRKFGGGWGCGTHRYESAPSPAWGGAPLGDGFAALAMHQDQVLEPPAEATTLARSDFCAHAALAYGDPAAPKAISIQPHPEFDAAFLTDLIEARRGGSIPEERAAAALTGLAQPTDHDRLGQWIVAFARSAAG